MASQKRQVTQKTPIEMRVQYVYEPHFSIFNENPIQPTRTRPRNNSRPNTPVQQQESTDFLMQAFDESLKHDPLDIFKSWNMLSDEEPVNDDFLMMLETISNQNPSNELDFTILSNQLQELFETGENNLPMLTLDEVKEVLL